MRQLLIACFIAAVLALIGVTLQAHDPCSDLAAEENWALDGFHTAYSDLDWVNLQIENEVSLGIWNPNSTDGQQLLTEQNTDIATENAMNTIIDADIRQMQRLGCPI